MVEFNSNIPNEKPKLPDTYWEQVKKQAQNPKGNIFDDLINENLRANISIFGKKE